jgi:hypothetical protein
MAICRAGPPPLSVWQYAYIQGKYRQIRFAEFPQTYSPIANLASESLFGKLLHQFHQLTVAVHHAVFHLI